jgi:hypothetical protein
LLAFGVIVFAVLMVVLTGWRRMPRPKRRPPTSGDPVGDALAGARPVSRFAGEELDPEELRQIVGVDELEVTAEGGCNTVVSFDDEVSSYADVFEDGLEEALLAQPGIEAAYHEDREVVAVRSVLSLADVHAAAIRALLAINHRPFPLRNHCLPTEVVKQAMDLPAGRGFEGRVRDGRYRVLGEERLVQVVVATAFEDHLTITVDVLEVDASVAPQRILSVSYDVVPATVAGVEQVLAREALPLCDCTASRAAIADRWVRGLPWHVPDRPAWEAADITARWGFDKHAGDLRRYGRKRP